MINEPIEFSDHARYQMGQRQITEAEARDVMHTGTWAPELMFPGRPGRVGKRKAVRDGEVLVVWVEKSDPTVVVTVMWLFDE